MSAAPTRSRRCGRRRCQAAAIGIANSNWVTSTRLDQRDRAEVQGHRLDPEADEVGGPADQPQRPAHQQSQQPPQPHRRSRCARSGRPCAPGPAATACCAACCCSDAEPANRNAATSPKPTPRSTGVLARGFARSALPEPARQAAVERGRGEPDRHRDAEPPRQVPSAAPDSTSRTRARAADPTGSWRGLILPYGRPRRSKKAVAMTPGTNTPDAHPGAGQLQAQAGGERVQTRLGRRVHRLAGHAGPAGDGGRRSTARPARARSIAGSSARVSSIGAVRLVAISSPGVSASIVDSSPAYPVPALATRMSTRPATASALAASRAGPRLGQVVHQRYRRSARPGRPGRPRRARAREGSRPGGEQFGGGPAEPDEAPVTSATAPRARMRDYRLLSTTRGWAGCVDGGPTRGLTIHTALGFQSRFSAVRARRRVAQEAGGAR